MSLHKQVSDHLMQLLAEKRARAPITYNQLADALAQPRVTEAWRSHPFCEAFGKLDEEDAAAGRPFRTALVFNDAKNMPGEGFFYTLQRLKKVSVPKDPLKRQTIYMKELGEAVSYYAQNPVR
jgi:hypothetical protein